MEITKIAPLSQIANINDAAVATFETLAQRRRFRSRTNLMRFQRELEQKFGKPIDEKELLKTFQALDLAGIGSLIIGRNKMTTSFIWNYSLRDVSKAAQGKLDTVHMKRLAPQRLVAQPKTRVIRRPHVEFKPQVEEVIVIQNGMARKINVPKEKADVFNQMLDVFNK